MGVLSDSEREGQVRDQGNKEIKYCIKKQKKKKETHQETNKLQNKNGKEEQMNTETRNFKSE